LGEVIKAQKDSLPIGHNKIVVYKLCCKNCNISYIGQIKRRLNIRILEHKKDINKKPANHSVIIEHRLDFKHEFDWDNPKIIDKEKQYYRRLISKINIKSQKNAINLKIDTELYNYYTIIRRNSEQCKT